MTHTYLTWATRELIDLTPQIINDVYNQGFVATRRGHGSFDQTRSIRINLATFEPTSENRRILRKTEEVALTSFTLPYTAYHWSIGKMAKDFYTEKFGDGTFSANKIKELLTDPTKSTFNQLLVYTLGSHSEPVGYCIALETDEMLHYCYPFYVLQATSYELPANLGLGMMLKAIARAKQEGKKYVYLGSAQRPTDTYKLQFAGLEWFDGTTWRTSSDDLKQLLQTKTAP